MNTVSKTTLVAGLCLVFSMAASVLVLRRLEQTQPQGSLEDVLLVNSPKLVHRASLGYDGLMADIYWTRAVQYFGHRNFERAHSYNELAPLLEITTHLDPHLLVAYQFGSSFLAPKPPNGAGQPERAIQLMNYGIENNPTDWHLYYDLGFIYYTELKDYARAADAFDRGSRVPDAHPFLKIMAAQMAQHAGEFKTARMLWTATYASTQDKQIKQNAMEHLRALKVDEDVATLQKAVAQFSQRVGRFPASMQELAAAERWPGLPSDPDGNAYMLASDGRVLVQQPDDFSFITQGLPPEYKPGPPKIHSRE